MLRDVPWIWALPLSFLVTLKTASFELGVGAGRATIHPVPWPSISFAGTGVKARVELFVFRPVLLATLGELGQLVPDPGFLIARTSEPVNALPTNTLMPMIAKAFESPSFG